jgi:phosphate starvation-inducible PhoH-like protein
LVDSTTVEHRLAAEGADQLLLGGVNDSNLQELARLSGCRVILRGDDLILSGDVADVERALPVAEHMIQQARIGQPFDADEIRRSFAAETQRPRGARPARRDGIAHDEQVLFAGLKKLIGSKSEGQREYLDAIVNNDIVIASGPAGTG